MENKKIFVTGIAGTGKSTVAQELQSKGIEVIDVDHVENLCGWVNNDTGKRAFVAEPDNEFMDTHEYKCDMKELLRLINEVNETVVVFGCVGDNNYFLPHFNKTLLFQCSPKVLMERLSTRDTNPFGKNLGVQSRIMDWRIIFDEQMLKNGAISIDAERPLDEVVEEVISYTK